MKKNVATLSLCIGIAYSMSASVAGTGPSPPAFVAGTGPSPYSQTVFEIGPDWVETIGQSSSLILSVSPDGTASITAEQYLRYIIDTEWNPKRRHKLMQALESGAYKVELYENAFILTTTEIF